MRIFNYKVISGKKSSLSLSINAIVILILAITMLGLGLGFMKGMFSKVSKQVETAIDATELENPPTADKPMTMSARNIKLKRGEDFRLDIGFFNKYNSVSFTSVSTPVSTASTASTAVSCAPVNFFTFTKPGEKETKINGKEAFSVLIEVADTADSITSVCTFKLKSTTETKGAGTALGTLSKELFIKVP